MAFYDCENLSDLRVPDGVAQIGIRAFSGCRSLADPDGFVVVRNVLYSYHGAGGAITLPDGVTTVSKMAFCRLDTLTAVTVPAGVTGIGGAAFYSCTQLETVSLPASVVSVGPEAFRWCDKLRICAPAGSYAEACAKEYGIPVVTK
jgi:hypothetical protein